MAQGGISCMKYLVFFCNLLFALSGLLILTVGAIVQSNYHHYSNFVGENVWTAPIILIIVGIVVFIIGFLGCCGAVKENSCMILTFSILIVIIFLAELGAGIAGYVKHGELKGIIETEFNKTMQQYDNSKVYRDAWDVMQTDLNCCGINKADDWPTNNLPKSCCNELPIGQNNCTKDEPSYVHKDGCLNKLLTLLDSNVLILGGVGITVAVIQLLTIFYACCLYRSFRQNYETV